VRRAAIIGLALAFGAAACGQEQAKERKEAGSSAPAKVLAAVTQPVPGQRYAASNILIAFRGAKRAAASVTRTEGEAKELAEKLYAEVVAGADLGALADQYSDGPERGHGGRLGIFAAGARMLPEIMTAVAGLPIGGVAPPVRSDFGYHVIRRDPIEEVYIAEIVVAFAGADKAPADVTRTRDEAGVRAKEALAALAAPGATFDEVAAKYSDHPTKVRGGVIGRVFRGLLPPALEKVAFGLEPGGVGGPVDMPNGVTILRRLPEAGVRHILVAFQGATHAPATVTRTKDEAAALIAEVRDKLARGDDFAKLAESTSDCASKAQGGDLGTVAEGTMTQRFERAVFALKPGERSGIVETEFGFHIFERYR
jgi:parvulin-like peptidyl-prolyl isomerase